MPTIIYLEDKRREIAGWASKVQHLVAGISLFVVAVPKLAEETDRPMALVEVAIAAVVIGAFLKEVRDARHHRHESGAAHPPVGWFDLAAGGLLMFEAFHGAHHKPGYLRPPFFSGICTLALGAFHARFHGFKHRRRYLKVDDTWLEYRPALFGRVRVQWTDLSAVKLGDREAVLERKDGRRHRIVLNRFRNGMALRNAIEGHAGTAGLLV